MTIMKVANVKFFKRLGFTYNQKSKLPFDSVIDSNILLVNERFRRYGCVNPEFKYAPFSVKAMNTDIMREHNIEIDFECANIGYDFQDTEKDDPIMSYKINAVSVLLEFEDKRHIHMFKLTGGLNKLVARYNSNFPSVKRQNYIDSREHYGIENIQFLD